LITDRCSNTIRLLTDVAIPSDVINNESLKENKYKKNAKNLTNTRTFVIAVIIGVAEIFAEGQKKCFWK
jgi:hypothetical protein